MQPKGTAPRELHFDQHEGERKAEGVVTSPGEVVQSKQEKKTQNNKYDKRLLINQKGCVLPAAF